MLEGSNVGKNRGNPMFAFPLRYLFRSVDIFWNAFSESSVDFLSRLGELDESNRDASTT